MEYKKYMKHTSNPRTTRLIARCTILFLFLCAASYAYASPAQEMDALLATSEVNYGQAARILLILTDNAPQSINEDAAFVEVKTKEWLPSKTQINDSVTMGNVSMLVMHAFDMKGGFMQRLFPGPRYSFREMSRNGLLPSPSDPSHKISGADLLNILDKVSVYTGREL